MASFSNDVNGNTRILFTGHDGKRYTLRPGKLNKKTANELKLKVEHLNALTVAQLPMDADTARWVANIGDELAAKLAAVGLIPERPKAIDMAGLVVAYREKVASRQKLSTQTVLPWGNLPHPTGYFRRRDKILPSVPIRVARQ